MAQRPLKVAWISFFPVEWLPDLPEPLRNHPRLHPSPWQRVLLRELQAFPELKIHVVVVRRYFDRHFVFERDGVTFHCLKSPGGWRRLSLFWIDTMLVRGCLLKVQ